MATSYVSGAREGGGEGTHDGGGEHGERAAAVEEDGECAWEKEGQWEEVRGGWEERGLEFPRLEDLLLRKTFGGSEGEEADFDGRVREREVMFIQYLWGKRSLARHYTSGVYRDARINEQIEGRLTVDMYLVIERPG